MSTPRPFTPYQRQVRDQDAGLFAMLWRRQGFKTTTFGTLALRDMARHPGMLVTFASASLLVGREVIQKESMIFRDLMAAASTKDRPVELIDSRTGTRPTREDDLAAAFESGRLESRLWHDRTTYSRTLVIAPNPATARGFSGMVYIDEIGFIRDFRDVWEAMEPIFSANKTFRCRLATTPPKDDRHFSHELLAAPAGLSFEPDASGHWYRSEMGMLVHRVDVADAALAGVKLFSKESREEITPAEHRAEQLDRDAWDRNYALIFSKGGTSACSLVDLKLAQEHPESAQCLAAEDDLPDGFETLVSDGKVTLGLDLATTENETSNPSSLTVLENVQGLYVARLILRWKTADPNVTRAIVYSVVRRLNGKAKSIGIDATNERFFATDLRMLLWNEIHVELVNSSETILSDGASVRMKTYMGNLVVAALDDSKVALPAAQWVRSDFRLVRKEKGNFDNDTDAAGNHGDAFDGFKLALHMQTRRDHGRFVAMRNPGRAARAFADRSERSLVG